MDVSGPTLWLLTLTALATCGGACVLLRRRLLRVEAELRSARQRHAYQARILENCEDIAWLLDIETGHLVYITPSVERHCGWSTAELFGKPALEAVPHAVAESFRKLLGELNGRIDTEHRDPPATRIETEVTLQNGGLLAIETECKLLRDDSGKPSLLLGISRDISEHLRLERELRDAEERVRLALHCSGDGVWDANLQTRKMDYLEGWEDVLGYGKSDIASSMDGYLGLVHTEDAKTLLAELDRHIRGEVPSFQCEYRMRTKDGGWRWVLSRGRLWSHSADGTPLRMIGTHTDITSRKVAEVAMSRANLRLHSQIDEIRTLQTRLAEQAVRDPMTGLYNRRYLDETLEREVARARREGHPLSIVMLDVDHFKKLNDTYGHQAGDEVLKALAGLLRDNTRTEDVACRYGGEEFLVLLPSMPLDKACERAERWRNQLEQKTFYFGNFSLSVTASFGVSSYPHHGKTPDDLTRAADAALYSAKHNGRNRVEKYGDEPIVFLPGSAPGS